MQAPAATLCPEQTPRADTRSHPLRGTDARNALEISRFAPLHPTRRSAASRIVSRFTAALWYGRGMRSAPLHTLLAALFVAACSDNSSTPATPDAPADTAVVDTPVVDTPVVTDRGAVDAPVDTGPLPLFSPCTSRVQCGSGRVCSSIADGYPGGSCTKACTRDADCGAEGICWPFVGGGSRCIPRCDTVADCREGYQCLGISGREDRACFPFCTADSQCAPMACNQWTRTCGTTDSTRAENGAACAASADCRSGRCTREVNTDGAPTGSLGGICYSLCTVPPNTAYNGTTIPRADCPMGSVCPRDSTTTAGGVGLCRVECTTNDQCRPGFICVHPSRPGADAGTYTNGYCAAMNCRYMTQMCPSFATCQTTRTDDAGVATSGICVRNDPDASDAPTDATADAAGDLGATDGSASDAGASDASAADAPTG